MDAWRDSWSRKTRPGFRANDIEGKFSLRMSRTSECWFDELPDSGIEPFAERERIARAVVMSFTSANRYCLGGDWGSDRLL